MSENVKAALGKLDANNDNHWTSDGLPRLETVRMLSGDQKLTREQVTTADPGFTRTGKAAPKTAAGDVPPETTGSVDGFDPAHPSVVEASKGTPDIRPAGKNEGKAEIKDIPDPALKGSGQESTNPPTPTIATGPHVDADGNPAGMPAPAAGGQAMFEAGGPHLNDAEGRNPVGLNEGPGYHGNSNAKLVDGSSPTPTGDDARDDASSTDDPDSVVTNKEEEDHPDHPLRVALRDAEEDLADLVNYQTQLEAAVKKAHAKVDAAHDKVVSTLGKETSADAIGSYLESQKRLLQERADKQNAFKASGLKLKDILPQRAPIDQAMSRKNTRGKARPVVPKQ